MPRDNIVDRLRETSDVLQAMVGDVLLDTYLPSETPTTRDTARVLECIETVEAEFSHHIRRIRAQDLSRLDQPEHLLDLAAQYANARRACGLLRRYIAGRHARARAAHTSP